MWDGKRSFSFARTIDSATVMDYANGWLYWVPYYWCTGFSFIEDPENWSLLEEPENKFLRPDNWLPTRLETGAWQTIDSKADDRICTFRDGTGDQAETLVLDRSMNYALVERPRLYELDGSFIGVFNEEFTEVLPGLWLPIKSRIERYEPGEDPGAVLALEVTKIDVNTTHDSDLELRIPSGTTVVGADGQVWTNLEPGRSQIDAAIAEARLRATVSLSRRRVRRIFLVGVNCLMLFVIVGLFLLQKRRGTTES